MRASRLAWTAVWVLSVPVVQAQQTTASSLPVAGPRSFTTSTSSGSFLRATTLSETVSPHTTLSSSNTPNSAIPTSSVATLIIASPSSTLLSDATAPSSANLSSPTTVRDRNLIIILCSVLGTVVLALIVIGVCLTCRYKRGKSPFRQGGVSPINDDEIESWRNTLEQKRPIVNATFSPHNSHTPRIPSVDSIALKQHSPNWSWSPPAHGHNSSTPGQRSQTPDFLARAPNSRVGLTDETIPGAVPFIPPVKRQSSRLSKAPPGHSRSKSRRSSMSAKSMRSYTGGPVVDMPVHVTEMSPTESMPTWYDQDSESVVTKMRSNDSPGTSIFDGLGVPGGLSPRPRSKTSRPWNQSSQEWDKETGVTGNPSTIAHDYSWNHASGGIGRAVTQDNSWQKETGGIGRAIA